MGERSRPVSQIGPGGGAVLRFAAAEGIVPGLLEHDLGLHDLPPLPASPMAPRRLVELPVVSLDTETTGLDVRHDRLLSVGAVHLHGHRLYLGETFDRLVNPGPAISAGLDGDPQHHRCHDRRAPGLCQHGRRARPLLRRARLGRPQYRLDAAILRREAKLAGLAWSEPVMLDTLRVYAALYPRAPDVELDAVAEELGVDVSGGIPRSAMRWSRPRSIAGSCRCWPRRGSRHWRRRWPSPSARI